MKPNSRLKRLPIAAWCIAMLPIAVAGQGFVVAEFPEPANFYQNTTFTIDGPVAYVPTYDNDTLWSISIPDGQLLDEDGLALPAPGTSSDATVFPNGRLAIPGWFPSQSIFVVDISDPTNLAQIGIIEVGPSSNIQGQEIEVDPNGVIGYVASFPNDTLFSFNVQTLSLEDPDGLSLPGNPDRIALAGDRVAIVDTTNGRIIVADVSDPANLVLAGTIALPGFPTFASNDNIVFAADNRTGFVSSNQRVLYSFDVIDLTLLDPNGVAFGNQSFGDDIAIHGDTVACIWSRGLAFIDVSDPTDMVIRSNAQFGGTISPQGSATVEFTADGTKAAMPVIFPDFLVYTFDVATGTRISPAFAVGDQPNYLTVFEPGDRIGVLCSSSVDIYLILGLFGPDGDFDDDADLDAFDFDEFLNCFTGPGGGVPPGCEDGDLEEDDDIDFADFGVIQRNYTGGF